MNTLNRLGVCQRGGLTALCCLLAAFGGCPAGTETPVTQEPAAALPVDDSQTQRNSAPKFQVLPNSGPVEGGTIVTIVGTSFGDGTSVQFGDNASPEVTFFNKQLLTAVVPPGDPGTVNVTLRIPSPEGTFAIQVAPSGYSYYVLPPDDGTDSDGDGLTDVEELTGWEVWIDAFGLALGQDTFGNVSDLSRYTCLSDPHNSDTDGDGLTDKEEFLLKTDARRIDTDGDGLNDFEEVRRWHTSPTSIDSDYDSRGTDDLRNPPNPALFDGAELKTAGYEKPNELFFSEYVEGGGNNHALEIFNPTDAGISLLESGYQVVIQAQDGTLQTIDLDPLYIAAHGTAVIADPGASAAIRNAASILLPLPFDGDDLVMLKHAGAVIDSIGQAASETTLDQFQFEGDESVNPDGVWQSFTPAVSGQLTKIEARFFNATNGPRHLSIDVFAGEGTTGQLLATSHTETIASFDWQVPPFHFDQAPLVVAGQKYTFRFHAETDPNLVVYWDRPYGGDSYYGGGHISFDSNGDLAFFTYIAPSPSGPWGAEDVSTRGRALLRRGGACLGDTNIGDTFDPAAQWFGRPAELADDLGRFTGALLPSRIVNGGTSPSLADTDGDGWTDYQEFDHPSRSPVIADLPQMELVVATPVDIRLNVEYAEEQGKSHEYGAEFTTGSSTTNTTTNTQSINYSLSNSWEIGTEAGFPSGAEVKASTTIDLSIGGETTWETSTESTTSSETTYSQLTSDSRTLTETSATGSIKLGVKIKNSGPVSFRLTNLGLTVKHWQPHADPAHPEDPGEFKTLATLVPVLPEVTLAPGESTPVLEVSNDEVNAKIIKEFLARPNSLIFEPAYYDLENADGLNFAFLREFTFARTAQVVIDYGNGAVERYLVATNVDRNLDGSYRGVTLKTVLNETLKIPYATQQQLDGQGNPKGVILTQVRSLPEGGPSPLAFWGVFGSPTNIETANFDDIVLRPGDVVTFALTRDSDGDGLLAAEEKFFRTSDNTADTDSDGINDAEEIRNSVDPNTGVVLEGGWEVHVEGQPAYRVITSPTQGDADHDGLTDGEERAGRDGILPGEPGDKSDATDPLLADTDGDGLDDVEDPYPLKPARRYYVKAGVDGLGGYSWDDAFAEVDYALWNARSLNSDSNPANDIAEIWVAQGTYTPVISTSFPMPPHVKIYGGFTGNEEKLSQRNLDPLTNNTVFSGNVGNPNSKTDNLMNFLVFNNQVVGTVLDGFTITGGYETNQGAGGGAAAIFTGGTATIRNCYFVDNYTVYNGGAVLIQNCSPHFEACIFNQNSALYGGGGVSIASGAPVFDACDFAGNDIRTTNGNQLGGGGVCAAGVPGTIPTPIFNSCIFERNTTTGYVKGCGLYVNDYAKVTLNGCHFRNNMPTEFSTNTQFHEGGGVYNLGTVYAYNCTFFGNRAVKRGGGFSAYALAGGQTDSYLYNCSFSGNATGHELLQSANISADSGGLWQQNGTLKAVNCIFHGNASYRYFSNAYVALPFWGYDTNWEANINWLDSGSNVTSIVSSLVTGYSYEKYPVFKQPFNGNILSPVDAPVFVAGPTLRPAEGSLAIDAGNRFIDADPLVLGAQKLPLFDAEGNPRLADGNLDGVLEIDMGAYEFQGSE